MPVSAERNGGYAVGSLIVSWNSDMLILKAVEYNAELAPENQPAPIKNSGSYRVCFGDYLASENFTGTGVLFTLVFTAADSAKPDTYPVTFSKPDFLDKDTNAVQVSCTDGAVILTAEETPAFLLGDVNGDGEISVEDAQLTLIEYVNTMSGLDSGFSEKQKLAGDINGDKVISVEDAQNILLYYVSNMLSGQNVTWDELLGKNKPADSLPFLMKLEEPDAP